MQRTKVTNRATQQATLSKYPGKGKVRVKSYSVKSHVRSYPKR